MISFDEWVELVSLASEWRQAVCYHTPTDSLEVSEVLDEYPYSSEILSVSESEEL
jgi:hypothetical protein